MPSACPISIRWTVFNQVTAGNLGVAITRVPSMIRVSWDLNVAEQLNLPFTASVDRIKLDVIRDFWRPGRHQIRPARRGKAVCVYFRFDRHRFGAQCPEPAVRQRVRFGGACDPAS